MKRTLASAALGLAIPACMAQATGSVQLYGVVDAGVSRVTGLRGGTQNSLVSGIMDGSRLGFKGSEDLGDGYRALFTMESRVEADTGGTSNRAASGSQLPDRLSQTALLGLPAALQPAVTGVANSLGGSIGVNLENRFFDRQLFVGLVTPYGALLAGRQYTPGFEVGATFDTLESQSALAAGGVGAFPAVLDLRLSNTIAYRAVSGPFSGALMVGAGERSATSGRFYGGNAMYRTEAFSIGVGHNQRDNELGKKSLRTTVIGASAKVGPGALVAQVAAAKDDNPSGLSGIAASITSLTGAAAAQLVQNAFVNAVKQDSRLYHVGYRLPIDVHKLYFAYSVLDDRRASDADTSSYGAAFTYTLSRRTNLNFVVARFNNKNLAQAAPGQAGSLGGVTARAGTDSTSLSVGVRHMF